MLSLEGMPEHSPLGASGASRWMKCPGSVSFGKGDSGESSIYAQTGSAAHCVLEKCLKEGKDAWEFVQLYYDVEADIIHGQEEVEGFILIDKEIADGVQVMLDEVRKRHPDASDNNSWVERVFHARVIHPLMYGRSDFTYYDDEAKTLHIWDYKNGAGVIVDVQRNTQGMYYAVGMLEELDLWLSAMTVTIHIVQPNGYHSDGIVREWSVKVSDLADWLEEELLPAMYEAETGTRVTAGPHCRFCPKRFLKCEALMGQWKELKRIMVITEKKGGPAKLTPKELSALLKSYESSRIMFQSAEKTAFDKLNAGKKVPYFKLVKKQVTRKWKEGAEQEINSVLGKQAYDSKLKSPAQIEKLAGGEALAAKYSEKPPAGLKLAPMSAAGNEVNKDTAKLFKKVAS
tara:strand:- start:2001 stop:3203 length:1203 start_codon:yes stop_codon:yes gene_type:complete